MSNQVLDFLRRWTLVEATIWLTAANVAMFAASLAVGHALARRYFERPVTRPPDPLSAAEIWLAVSCVVLNSVVAVAGWALWQASWITVRTGLFGTSESFVPPPSLAAAPSSSVLSLDPPQAARTIIEISAESRAGDLSLRVQIRFIFHLVNGLYGGGP